ncbi:MAG: ribosome small subunit-dependent GTPase A [Tidjanibacter sp.]|nr:ribosome small subunit-dependent GTPase A [Tidjanibacter sp.]
MIQEGFVVESTGSWYKVEIAGEVYDCRTRGRLRLKGVRSTSPVVVGDRVGVEFSEEGDGVIVSIAQRRNYIIRRASNLSKESHIIAANIDCAAVVVTIAAPVTAPEFVDRFLVTCEAYKVPAVIILNKIDTAREHPELLQHFHDVYRSAGYRVIECSALTGEGLEEVVELLRDKTTLLAGNSGVGKSTLVNAINPSADAKTGAISDVHLQGKHTTTFSHVYPLPFGGRLIDTPGIRGFGLIDIKPEELYHYFPEIMRESAGCKFYNCTHTHEPQCAVMHAVVEGRISESRYESYLKMLDDDGKYR